MDRENKKQEFLQRLYIQLLIEQKEIPDEFERCFMDNLEDLFA